MRNLRERLGLTQVELAESIGLDASTVRAVEAGRRGCSLAVLVNMAGKLGVSPGELLNPERPKTDRGSDAALPHLVASLGAEEQSLAVDLLRVLKKHSVRKD